MNHYTVNSIGTIHVNGEEMYIQTDRHYLPALQALEGFSHICILWWCSQCDTGELRSILNTPQPYRNSPELMGIFATRSPARPNPIALTTVEVLHIDHISGIIQIAYIDAFDASPVIDIKPYTPSLDRVESPEVPTWCSNWPKSIEQSGAFDWSQVFNF